MDSFRKLKVKNVSDLLATAFLLIAVISTFLFEVQSITQFIDFSILQIICISVVLPHIHTIDVTIQYFHTCAGIFILFNVLSNLYWLITTDNTTSGLLLPSVLKPNWRFCLSCEANSPPRSFHCHNCERCVLKRDHHCVFSGCCVGYKNFRLVLDQKGLIYCLF